MKKLRFNDKVIIHKIPYEDRINYNILDKQRFDLRINEFEKTFKKIVLNKWLIKCGRFLKTQNIEK